MSYDVATSELLKDEGVELSTMMKTPCLRYKGEFLTMFFDNWTFDKIRGTASKWEHEQPRTCTTN